MVLLFNIFKAKFQPQMFLWNTVASIQSAALQNPRKARRLYSSPVSGVTLNYTTYYLRRSFASNADVSQEPHYHKGLPDDWFPWQLVVYLQPELFILESRLSKCCSLYSKSHNSQFYSLFKYFHWLG